MRVPPNAPGTEREPDLEPAQVSRHPADCPSGGGRRREDALPDGPWSAGCSGGTRRTPSASGRECAAPVDPCADGVAGALTRDRRRRRSIVGEAHGPARARPEAGWPGARPGREHEHVLVLVLEVLDRADQRGRGVPARGWHEQQSRARAIAPGERLRDSASAVLADHHQHRSTCGCARRRCRPARRPAAAARRCPSRPSAGRAPRARRAGTSGSTGATRSRRCCAAAAGTWRRARRNPAGSSVTSSTSVSARTWPPRQRRRLGLPREQRNLGDRRTGADLTDLDVDPVPVPDENAADPGDDHVHLGRPVALGKTCRRPGPDRWVRTPRTRSASSADRLRKNDGASTVTRWPPAVGSLGSRRLSFADHQAIPLPVPGSEKCQPSRASSARARHQRTRSTLRTVGN